MPVIKHKSLINRRLLWLETGIAVLGVALSLAAFLRADANSSTLVIITTMVVISASETVRRFIVSRDILNPPNDKVSDRPE